MGSPNPEYLQTPGTALTALSPLPGPDLSDVTELVEMMKKTLGTLGASFDSVAEQTAKVAALGPAIDCAYQVTFIHSSSFIQKYRVQHKLC
jgi:DNA-binding transcriptional regulator YbjK